MSVSATGFNESIRTARPEVEVRALGRIHVIVADRSFGPEDFGGIKPKQLLEILVTERGRVIGKERLAKLLWGEVAPVNPSATLETYVSLVRRRLEPARRCRCLVTEFRGYRLDTSTVKVDVDLFESLALAGRRARSVGDIETAATQFARALAIYQGPFLEDELTSSWALEPRARLQRGYVDLLVDLAEVAVVHGSREEAWHYAEMALAIDSVREDAARLWMLAAYALGRRDEALRGYEQVRIRLSRDLGVTPSRATADMHSRIAQGLPVQQLLAEIRRSGPAAPVRIARSIPFLGREQELQTMRDTLAMAGAAGAQLIVVEGEAGMGKSRLVTEFIQTNRLRAGIANCVELEREVPFSALAACLEDVLGTIGEDDRRQLLQTAPALALLLSELPDALGQSIAALPPDVARIRLLDAVASTVRALAPVVVFIDDMHWIDASTVQGVARILLRGTNVPILLVAAMRPVEARRNPAAQKLIELARASGRLRSMALEPLPRSALDAMLAEGADPAALWAASGGNPLLLAERVSAEHGERLEDAILNRAHVMSPRAQELLESASVLFGSFRPDLPGRIAGNPSAGDDSCLRELLHGGLIVDVAGELSFSHDLIRKSVYDSVPLIHRQELHKRALAALETTAAISAAELARHANLAGAWSDAVRLSHAAGERAVELFANSEAAAHFGRAVEIIRAHPGVGRSGEVAALLVQQATALTAIGRPSEALGLLEEALRALGEGDARLQLEANRQLAAAQLAASRPALAAGPASRALQLARRLDEEELVALANGLLADVESGLGQIEGGESLARRALASYQRRGVDPPASLLYRIGFMRHCQADERGAIAAFDSAESLALVQHDGTSLVLARWARSLGLANLGRYREAFASLRAADAVATGEEAGPKSRLANTMGAFLGDLGLWQEALDQTLEGLDSFDAAGLAENESRIHTLLDLAEAHLALGHQASAAKNIAEVERTMADVERDRFRYYNRLLYLRSLAALLQDQCTTAFELAEMCLRDAKLYRAPKYELRGRLMRGRALMGLGEKEVGITELQRAAELADALGYVSWSWRSWGALARTMRSTSAAGRASDAARRLADNLDPDMRSRFARTVPLVARTV